MWPDCQPPTTPQPALPATGLVDVVALVVVAWVVAGFGVALVFGAAARKRDER